MSTSSKPQLTSEQIQKTRARFARFRILVIGRANAGKTTILRRLCNTTGEPIIFDPDGQKIESSALNPSMGRGEHDIENQMIFESNPGFVFHDSRGFEAGGARELKLVQEFIKQRSKAKNVNNQLHAIWYCIPTSDDRPITAAEKFFFNECGTGLVPVIVLWTKTDSLDVTKFKQLMKDGNLNRSEAKERAPQESWADFEKDIYQHFDEFKYKPKAYVVFRNMHEPGADCNDLLKKTTAALSSEELQQLFVSTQQNNVELCVSYGVRRILNSPKSTLQKDFEKNKRNWAYFVKIVLMYFPQFFEFNLLDLTATDDLYFEEKSELYYEFSEFQFKFFKKSKFSQHHNLKSISKIMSPILSGLSTEFNLKEVTYCAIVAAIVCHLDFFLHQESPEDRKTLEQAVQTYQQSACDTSVKQRILQFENLFEGSHQSHPNRAFFKFFKQSHANQDANHELLINEAVQTALDNLISMK